jgi:predicted phage terminase large subunit-like protein
MLSSRDIHNITRERCKESFYFFVRHFWNTIVAEEPVWNWHIPLICNELQAIGERVKQRLPKEYDYYIINVPPGSSKSTIASEMYPLWCWIIDPSQRFICGSYASTPAEDIAGKCFNIYTSDKFKRLFPELHTKRAIGGKTGFSNGLLGERYTTSTGSSITGIHAHQLIIDDPMNPKIANSDTERTSANKWVSETLSSRKVDKKVSVTIVIMQRLHENDTTGYLLAKQKEGLTIKHICIPAEVSDNNMQDVHPQSLLPYYKDGLFDTVRAPREVLIQTKVDLGSYGYAGQMLQRPAPAEGGILKKDWFGIIARHEVFPGQIVHFQLDTAYTEKTKNDPTAIIAYYIMQGHVYIANVQSVHKEFPDLIRWLPAFVKENGGNQRSKIYVEPKASGLSVVQTLKKATNLNIITSEAPKEDKESRVQTVSPKIEAGRIILHAGGWNEHFLNQCTSFPNAQHDDEVDCLVAIILREIWTERVDISMFAGAFR